MITVSETTGPVETVRFRAMGGPCELTLWPSGSVSMASLIAKLECELERLEKKYSRFRCNSLLSRINAGELNGQTLDDETAGLLNYVDKCFLASNGLFDPTIGHLHSVWRFDSGQLPEPCAIEEALGRVGWRNLAWDGQALVLPDNMSLDLGGVVKEFAVDRMVQMLREHQVSGLVNLAGDIAASGPQPGHRPWMIAIQHPRKGHAYAEVPVYRGAIATSGDYERYMIVNDVRYCHLLRPDTGYPELNGFSSVSVLADQCLLAGSASTVAMLSGLGGEDWLQNLGLPYLAIDQHMNASGAIKGSLE